MLACFILLFGIFAALPAAAEESDLYYVNVQILKIFPHPLGYYIIYRRAGLKTGECYIPQKWFDRRDSRAVLNLTSFDINPYMSIIMKAGKFDHVQIVAPRNIQNVAWGTLDNPTEVSAKFNVETIPLEF